MSSLLQSKPLVVPIQTSSHNALNGSDSETLAASYLVAACRGEIQWGSREEDNSKIDLILSCEHPWYKGERMLVLSQVKSGEAYGETTTKGFKLKSSAIKAAQRTSHSICIVWVDRNENQTYWAYVHPHSKVINHEFGFYHKITPASLYDIARCMSRDRATLSGGKGIIVRQRHCNVTSRRATVKAVYRSFNDIFSPSLGSIELTRLAWRHMFRSGRTSIYKESSLNIIPYLEKIVKQSPTTQAITDSIEWKSKGYTYRKVEHLLKYSEVLLAERGNLEHKHIEVIVKAIEEIRYPDNWRTNAMLSQCVERRVVLRSAYYK